MHINSIEQEAIQKYIKNLKYFENTHPKVFKKLNTLDIAINNGLYKENYALEYLEEGYFDVKDIRSGEYLYGKDIVNHTKKSSQNVNFSKKDGVIECFYNKEYYSHLIHHLKTTDVMKHYHTTVAPIVDIFQRYSIDKVEFEKIPKFIFFGVGLGLHIKEIHNKLDTPVYFIVENDLELFRLSLFTMDYQLLHNNGATVLFSIGENNEDFIKSFETFFNESYITNHYIKYFSISEAYFEKIKEIQYFIINIPYLCYTHEKVLENYITTIELFKNKYRFLNISKHFDKTIFEDKPVIILGAGPSLEKNIKWLKKNQNKFIVIAVFSILPKLFQEDITPDIIIHLDYIEKPMRKVISQIDFKNFTKNSIFIFMANNIPMHLFEPFNIKERTIFFESRSHYKKDFGYLQAKSVGEISYALALIFNTKEIFLLGLDLALDPESGKVYSSGHTNERKLDIKDTEETIMSLEDSVVTAKGNFRDSVYTTPLLKDSIQFMDKFSYEYKKEEQKVYNLNDGAYFKGIQPLAVKDIDLDRYQKIDKEKLFFELLTTFKKYSSNELTNEEKKMFEKRLKEIYSKKQIVKKFQKQKFQNKLELLFAFADLIEKLIHYNQSRYFMQNSQYLLIYLKNICGYITDFCFSKEVEDEQKIIYEIQEKLPEQLLRLLNRYEEAIKEI